MYYVVCSIRIYLYLSFYILLHDWQLADRSKKHKGLHLNTAGFWKTLRKSTDSKCGLGRPRRNETSVALFQLLQGNFSSTCQTDCWLTMVVSTARARTGSTG